MNDSRTIDNSSAGNGELPSASTALLRLARQMNPGAWGRIVDVFGPIIYRWARTSGLATEDAADVVQDVLALIVRNLDKFEKAKETGSFRSWIATITRNRVRDYFRKRGHEQRGIGGTTAWEKLQNVGGEPESDALEKSISLDSMNRQLPARVLEIVRAECEPRTWQAFWLTTVDQRSANGVAAELGMNVAAVYQAKSRVLRRLRQAMSELP